MTSQKITTTRKQFQTIKNKTALTIIDRPVTPVVEVEYFFNQEDEVHYVYDAAGRVRQYNRTRLLLKA